MSKEAALRAMREAHFREKSTGSPAAARPARPTLRPVETQAAKSAAPVPDGDALCGHRSMNGRACTREQGHAAKSHRYS
jgi:hypothetical protein